MNEQFRLSVSTALFIQTCLWNVHVVLCVWQFVHIPSGAIYAVLYFFWQFVFISGLSPCQGAILVSQSHTLLNSTTCSCTWHIGSFPSWTLCTRAGFVLEEAYLIKLNHITWGDVVIRAELLLRSLWGTLPCFRDVWMCVCLGWGKTHIHSEFSEYLPMVPRWDGGIE